jgi:hypothetical protein
MNDGNAPSETSSGFRSSANRWRVGRFLCRNVGWLMLYAGTVGCLLWWYELRPRSMALERMQGTWHYTEGIGHNERRSSSGLVHVQGDTKWHLHPGHPQKDVWQAHAEHISVRPARDFFVVTRRYDFGGRNSYEDEFVVHMTEHRLDLVRGVTTLDPRMERKVETLRRAEVLPREAEEAIEAAKQTSEERTSRGD